jgi:hypothetical protein
VHPLPFESAHCECVAAKHGIHNMGATAHTGCTGCTNPLTHDPLGRTGPRRDLAGTSFASSELRPPPLLCVLAPASPLASPRPPPPPAHATLKLPSHSSGNLPTRSPPHPSAFRCTFRCKINLLPCLPLSTSQSRLLRAHARSLTTRLSYMMRKLTGPCVTVLAVQIGTQGATLASKSVCSQKGHREKCRSGFR